MGILLVQMEKGQDRIKYELAPPALEDTVAPWRGVTHVPPRKHARHAIPCVATAPPAHRHKPEITPV